MNSLLGDIAAVILFGVGFYIFKRKLTKSQTQNIKLSKPSIIETKIEDILTKFDGSTALSKLIGLIKHDTYITKETFNPFIILDQLHNHNTTPDISLINTIFDKLITTNDKENFERLKNLILCSNENEIFPSPNIVTFNILLKGLNDKFLDNKDQKDIIEKQIENILNELVKYNCTPNEITINTIIDVLITNDMVDKAWNYYDLMKEKYHLPPDTYTYTTLLKTIKNEDSQEKYIEKAFEIVKQIKISELNGIADEILYNSIIDKCVRYNKVKEAEAVFEDMKQNKNVIPGIIVYSLMIKLYGNNYNIEKVLSLYYEIKLQQTPNNILYGCVVNACIKCGALEQCLMIYDEIENNESIEMNIILYTTLIKGYSRKKNFKKCKEVYEKMEQDKNITPTISGHNAILDACVECNEFDEMCTIYQAIKQKAIDNENNPQPDIITYSTIIKGYSRMKKIDIVLDIYNFLKSKSNLILDEVVYNTILDGLGKANMYDKALEIYQDMINNQMKISNTTCSIMIKIYSKLGNVDKAEAIFDEMNTPSLITLTSMIQLMTKTKQIQKAIDIFENSVKSKIPIDQVIYNVIINGCIFNGRLEEACKYLLMSFNDDIRLCSDVYKNVLVNLCTSRTMEINKKISISTTICDELKKRKVKIDYDVYARVMKIVYRNVKKNLDYIIDKEVEYYKNIVKGDSLKYEKKFNTSYKKENEKKPTRQNRIYNYTNNKPANLSIDDDNWRRK